MKAIILAAGQATRLRPLTEKMPKCLLPIRGKPLIDYQIDALTKNGIRDIVVVVGFEKEKIIDHLSKNHPNLIFIFVENHEYKTTGPAHSLWHARSHLSGSTLYLNADVLYGPNIIKRVRKHPMPAVTAIQRVPWDEEQVNISLSDENCIEDIGKHVSEEDSHGEFIGVTKFGEDFNEKLIAVLERFAEEGNKNKYAVDALNQAIKKGTRMHVVDVTDLQTLEIDTLEDLARAERMFGPFTRFKQYHSFFSPKGFRARIKRLLSVILHRL